MSTAAGRAPAGSTLPSLRWRVRVDDARSGAANMAIDHVLAHALESELPGDVAILRLYRWDRPTISLGRHQPARAVYDRRRAEREGVDFVRRPTGGRAVLHDRELTYSVAVSLDHFGGLRRTYRRINEALAVGLRVLGVSAELADPAGRAPAPDAGACFREPAAGEVVIRGAEEGSTRSYRKLAGSAQLRIGRTILQHGSIPLAPGQELLDALKLGNGGRARSSTASGSGTAVGADIEIPVGTGGRGVSETRVAVAGGGPETGVAVERAGAESGTSLQPNGYTGTGRPAGAMTDVAGAAAGAAASDGGADAADLSGILGRVVHWEEAACAVGIGFREIFAGEWRPLDARLPDPRVAKQMSEHYSSRAWTWRI